MKLTIKLKLYYEGETTKKTSRNKNEFWLLTKSEKRRLRILIFFYSGCIVPDSLMDVFSTLTSELENGGIKRDRVFWWYSTTEVNKNKNWLHIAARGPHDVEWL